MQTALPTVQTALPTVQTALPTVRSAQQSFGHASLLLYHVFQWQRNIRPPRSYPDAILHQRQRQEGDAGYAPSPHPHGRCLRLYLTLGGYCRPCLSGRTRSEPQRVGCLHDHEEEVSGR